MKSFLLTRVAAFGILKNIIEKKMTTPSAFAKCTAFAEMSTADIKFTRLLVLSTLRYFGQAQAILNKYIKKKLTGKKRDIELVLIIGIIQLKFLNTAPHAAVDTTVELSKIIKQRYLSGFVNSVMHAVIKDNDFSMPDVLLNLPLWLKNKWVSRFGTERTRELLASSYLDPTLDLSVKGQIDKWAQKLEGEILQNGTLRCVFTENIPDLSGFDDGEWWVQEASASLPALMFENVDGKKGADLCAAPGGKTAQLVMRGAKVDAFDISEKRLEKLKENLIRLRIDDQVQVICSDALAIDTTKQYDFILLDAPCSATGTIKRHPDLFFLRSEDDVDRLSDLQKKLLDHAYKLLKNGGELVYSTCSLQEEENEGVVKSFLENHIDMERVTPKGEFFKPLLNQFGAVEVIPSLSIKQDGFYAVLLKKK